MMPVQPLWSALRRFLLPTLMVLLPACAPSAITTRQQPLDTSALETTLRRGASTVADVEAALGRPSGVGSILLPVERNPCTLLFYERVAVEPPTARDSRGYMTFDSQQDVLMVFFRDGRYAGFLWSSDTRKP